MRVWICCHLIWVLKIRPPWPCISASQKAPAMLRSQISPSGEARTSWGTWSSATVSGEAWRLGPAVVCLAAPKQRLDKSSVNPLRPTTCSMNLMDSITAASLDWGAPSLVIYSFVTDGGHIILRLVCYVRLCDLRVSVWVVRIVGRQGNKPIYCHQLL